MIIIESSINIFYVEGFQTHWVSIIKTIFSANHPIIIMTEICMVYSGDLGEPGGGTDRHSAFASQLSNAGYKVTLVTAKSTGPLPKRIQNLENIQIPFESKGI